MLQNLVKSSVGALVLLGASTAQAQTAPTGEQTIGDDDASEIIVTAQRRAERAQDVPSSLTVLDADSLSSQGALSLADYARKVPTLNIIGSQGAGTGQPTMRAVSTGGDRVSGVGIYLDDVPFTPASAFVLATAFSFDPDLADIDRLEVLAGPQSTLYGASAMGGLIRYISKQPSLDGTSGSARLFMSDIDGGSFGGGGKVSVTTPIVIDKLGVSASGFWRRDPGFVDNTQRGEKNVDRAEVYGGRLALRAKLSDNVETSLIGLLQDINRRGPNLVLLNPDLTPKAGLGFASPLDLPTNIRYRSIAWQSNVDLGFGQLTNIASYSRFAINLNNDYGYFAALAPGLPAGGGVNYHGRPVANKLTEELRLASKPGRFEWLLGGFLTREKGSNSILINGTNPDGTPVTTTASYYNIYSLGLRSKFVEKAIYGNLTFHLVPKVTIAGGLRYSANRQTLDAFSNGLIGGIGQALPTTEDALTYSGSITYAPSRQLTFYAKTGSAYRPGSVNPLNALQVAAGVPQSYQSDYLRNYEVGIKGSLANSRVTYTADLFHMDWSDIQTSQIVNGFSAVANGGAARINGAEGSLTALLAPGLSASMTGAYLDAEYTRSVPTANIFDGNALPYAPKFSGSFSVDYSRPDANRTVPIAGLTFSHTGAQNSPLSNGVSYRLPNIDRLDLRAGIERGEYRLLARIDNVNNAYGLTNAVTSTLRGRPLVGAVIRPRTYSLSLETRF